MAGAGQFSKADQGIFSFWIHSYRWRKPLKYVGFDGKGHQVCDCIHPRDLVPVLLKPIDRVKGPAICNFSGAPAIACRYVN
jgi:CDP-paratose 2-epimerase